MGNWDVAVLWVTDGVGLWAIASGVCLEAPLATVVAVAVSVVTGFHTYEAVVAGLGITVFILDEVDLACRRWIGPCARSLCSFDRGNREREGDCVTRGLGGMLSDGSVKSAVPMRKGPLARAR
jgi:hypothetical protein